MGQATFTATEMADGSETKTTGAINDAILKLVSVLPLALLEGVAISGEVNLYLTRDDGQAMRLHLYTHNDPSPDDVYHSGHWNEDEDDDDSDEEVGEG